MVARVEDRWLSKKKDSDGKRKRKSTYGVGNRWMAIWDDLDGIARTKKFPTQEQAQAFLDDVTADKKTGTYVDARAGEKFIGDLLDQWFSASVHWKASTRNAAESDIRAHLKPQWKDWTVGAVRKRDVQDWVGRIDLAPRTVGTIHGRFLTFMSWCVEERLIGKNPAAKVRLPKGRAREHLFLSVQQVTALADAIDEHFRPLIWLLATCGLRIGEAVELRVKDLQLDRGRIRIERSVVFVKGGPPIVGPPKSGKARTVSVAPFVAKMLQELVQHRRGNDLVFTTVRGFQIRPNNFKRRQFDNAVTKVNAAAGAARGLGVKKPVTVPEGLWVHDLRHTAASWLVRSGASVKAVQRQLGHATASITLDTYAGLFDQDLDDLSSRLELMIRPVPVADAA
ncbi:site-specific integrase [Glutamicibacter sp. FBE19]|uniref:tyrosine-type recombinase/integrase n=1 Tax=Glutamicibacter sp. FBE19 TaxID=2761534 RepID=UPI00189691D5|nr:site-specific integrase [Glutamicibacter sp. FBE19]MBF6671533.1 site-specific integrase [Glutamicibacter sp. FBE19]